MLDNTRKDPKLWIQQETRNRLEEIYLTLYRNREELQQRILTTPDHYKNAIIERETELVREYDLTTLITYILKHIKLYMEEQLKELEI